MCSTEWDQHVEIVISAKEIMFSVAFVCLGFFFHRSVCLCLSVSNLTQKTYERIAMKFYGGVQGSKRKKC